MTASDRTDVEAPTYLRLLKNPYAPRGFVVLGALSILVCWIIASLIIRGSKPAIRKDRS